MTQPASVVSRWLAVVLLVTSFVGCNDDGSQFVFEARIVDADDANPATGTDATDLFISIAEGDLPIRDFDFPITDGEFDATLEFASFSSLTRLRVRIEGPSTQLITAPPAFVPAASAGILKVVAATPSTCQRVTFAEMQSPRSSFGMVQSGTFALLAGGTSASSEQVEFFDALEWASRRFTEDFAISFLGETRAASVGEGQILVLPSVAGSFVFDMLNANDRVTSVELHDGAGTQSAIIAVPGLGAMVIGGETSTGPSARVTLVRPGAELASLELSQPRAGAAAAAIGEDVLVVGGDVNGTAEILVAGRVEGEPIASVSDGLRIGALLVSDGQERALLLGGTDGSEALRDDTLRFDGCPGTCSPSPGPVWSNARLDATVPENGTLIVGGESSRLVEAVAWKDEAVSIESVAELALPRADAGAIVYESGAFVVGGGDDGSGARDDFEFCVPDALDPL